MARRLSARQNHLVWFDKPISANNFKYRDEPVELASIASPSAPAPASAEPPSTTNTAPASSALEIRYRGATHTVPIVDGQRDDPRLPGLLRYEDWLRVLVVAEGARTEVLLTEAIERGEIQPRLVVVMRRPPEGFDPESWGRVRRKEFRYSFVHLLPPPALAADGSPFEVIDRSFADLRKLGDRDYRAANDLDGDYWMYAAMAHVTPPTLMGSTKGPIQEAMRSMGWTWPASATSIVGLAGGIAVLAVSGPRRMPADQPLA
jgi:hypothetical protein